MIAMDAAAWDAIWNDVGGLVTFIGISIAFYFLFKD